MCFFRRHFRANALEGSDFNCTCNSFMDKEENACTIVIGSNKKSLVTHYIACLRRFHEGSGDHIPRARADG